MNRVVVASLAVLLSCCSAFGQSLDKARLLYSNKLYEDAKRELVAVAVGTGSDEEKAEALDLLGEIALPNRFQPNVLQIGSSRMFPRDRGPGHLELE